MKKSQFFIIASVIILLNLVAISQHVIRSTFPVSSMPLDEFAFSRDVSLAVGEISRTAPAYSFKRDLWLLSEYSRSAGEWKFESSLCCRDACDCPAVNLANLTATGGQGAILKINSEKAAISSSLVIKAG